MNRRTGLFSAIRSMSEEKVRRELMEDRIWREFGHRCAVMVLDSSGFTVSSSTNGIVGYLCCISRLRDTVNGLLTGSGCPSFRFYADNIFARFPEVAGALEAAFLIHDTLAREKIMVCDDLDLRVCIGIGYGEVLLSEGEGVFGNEMNLASKLGEDIAGPGEILLTESAYGMVPAGRRSLFIEKHGRVSGMDIRYYMTNAAAPVE